MTIKGICLTSTENNYTSLSNSCKMMEELKNKLRIHLLFKVNINI